MAIDLMARGMAGSALEKIEQGGGTATKITLESQQLDPYAQVYTLKQDGELVGNINIPKDMVIENGYSVTYTDPSQFPEDFPSDYGIGTYVVLVIANSDNTRIFVPMDIMGISTDENNQLKLGSDGKLYVGEVPLDDYYKKTEVDGIVDNLVNGDSVTKNILNLEGWLISNGGTVEVNGDIIKTNITDNMFYKSLNFGIEKTVTLSCKNLSVSGGTNFKIQLLSSSNIVVGYINSTNKVVTCSAKYLRFSWGEAPTSISIEQIMLENGSEKTSYEPPIPSMKVLNDNINNINNKTKDCVKEEQFNALSEKVADIELFKFPNAIIHGEPTINNGQISGFSNANYLVLPSVFDLSGRGFEFKFAFTTKSDITTSQNILGSKYCMALFIQNSKLNLRVSSDGTSWDLVNIEGSTTIQPNKTYYAKISFSRLNYVLSLSTDDESYSEIGSKSVGDISPNPSELYIGVGNNFFNPFLGIINLNKCYLKVNQSIIWQGMDDAGLATRLATDLENIDEVGIANIKGIIKDEYIDRIDDTLNTQSDDIQDLKDNAVKKDASGNVTIEGKMQSKKPSSSSVYSDLHYPTSDTDSAFVVRNGYNIVSATPQSLTVQNAMAKKKTELDLDKGVSTTGDVIADMNGETPISLKQVNSGLQYYEQAGYLSKNLASISEKGNNVFIGKVKAGNTYNISFVQDSTENFWLWLYDDLNKSGELLAETVHQGSNGTNAYRVFTAQKDSYLYLNVAAKNQRDIMLTLSSEDAFINYAPYCPPNTDIAKVNNDLHKSMYVESNTMEMV